MGVDYDGYFGLGVKLTPEYVAEQDDIYEFLETLLEGSEYRFFDIGEGAYTGDQNIFCITIDKPFSNGKEGLIEKIELFEGFLIRKGVKFSGSIDVVGGLNVS